MPKATRKARATVRKHPAESGGGVVAAVIVLLLSAFNLEPTPQVVAALVTIVAAVPIAVTWFRER